MAPYEAMGEGASHRFARMMLAREES